MNDHILQIKSFNPVAMGKKLTAEPDCTKKLHLTKWIYQI